MGPTGLINWHIDIGNIITVIVLLVGLYRFSLTQAKSQTLRDQKIDIVLFGDSRLGVAGMVDDVDGLKRDRDAVCTHLGIDRRSSDRRHDEP